MSATHLRGRKTPASADAEPIKRKPPAPAWLTPLAKQEWDRVLPMLVKRRLICTADLGMVESYCMARGLMLELEVRRRSKGANPADPKLLRLQNQAMLTAARLSASLGLDPSSRARLMAANDDDGDGGVNPLDI